MTGVNCASIRSPPLAALRPTHRHALIVPAAAPPARPIRLAVAMPNADVDGLLVAHEFALQRLTQSEQLEWVARGADRDALIHARDRLPVTTYMETGSGGEGQRKARSRRCGADT